jgi:enoyl-CoA hydratase/carnithine racemase
LAPACSRRRARYPAFAPRGTGRALEILLVGDDLDEARAEEYGYVNRLIADYQLDGEVDRIASQVARLDRDAIRRTRSYFEQATLPEA